MVIRGAPAIGSAAAYGVVLAARGKMFRSLQDQKFALDQAYMGLLQVRPTAVNTRWALDRMRRVWSMGAFDSVQALSQALATEAQRIEEEDRQANQSMGHHGSALLPERASVLTYCNTGSLATAGLGTALGVIWTAFQAGKIRKVVVAETRPYLQGARLTAWELKKEGIPFELITDNMAGHLMKTEPIQAVLVGADRIAANGDTANKIGTYGLAVLAAHHRIPFYVVAPMSTVDLATSQGQDIPIEERSGEEVVLIQGKRLAPKGIHIRHPAFDVTPADLIAAIVTERGVARPPYRQTLKMLFASPTSPAAEARDTLSPPVALSR
jgi:methylthioribose-1-phosphate isomerase